MHPLHCAKVPTSVPEHCRQVLPPYFLTQVITEDGLVQASEEFSAAAHGDRPTLRDFCAGRAEAAAAAAAADAAAASDDERADARAEAETWTFLRILFEDNASECAAYRTHRP
jgi:hypothetical protein